MNVYDSDKISDLLVHHYNMARTEDPDNADILILNTCSIREKAQEKVFSELGRWKKIKQARPGTLIAVGGCVASQEGRALNKPTRDATAGRKAPRSCPSHRDCPRGSGCWNPDACPTGSHQRHLLPLSGPQPSHKTSAQPRRWHSTAEKTHVSKRADYGPVPGRGQVKAPS